VFPKKIALATAAGAALAFAAPAFADPPRWAPAPGYRHHQQEKHRGHSHGFVVVAPRPVFIAPPPARVIYRPYVVYSPPPAVVYSAPFDGTAAATIGGAVLGAYLGYRIASDF
jgi:hypothetical protein